MWNSVSITLLLTVLCPLCVYAAPEPFACPEELPHPEQTLSEVPVGFNAMTMVPHPVLQLDGFRINVGHPDLPDQVKDYKRAVKRDAKGVSTETLTWNVSKLRDAYAVCVYRSTTQTLIRSLAGYRECKQVSSTFGDGMLQLDGASCK